MEDTVARRGMFEGNLIYSPKLSHTGRGRGRGEGKGEGKGGRRKGEKKKKGKKSKIYLVLDSGVMTGGKEMWWNFLALSRNTASPRFMKLLFVFFVFVGGKHRHPSPV